MADPAAPWWRLRWAAVGACVAVAVIAATWAIAHLVRTPEQVLSEASPPLPSRITAAVTEQVLQPDVITAGRLTSATTVAGQLTVRDRSQNPKPDGVAVLFAAEQVPARLTRIAADGTFTVTMAHPVREDETASPRVRFTSPHANVTQLTVPITALFTTPSGDTAVVLVVDGKEHQVRVTLGLQGAGYAGIAPVGGVIRPGDRVLVSQPGT